MSLGGIHRGFLKKYGGFMFKQWKERYLVLTVEGSLMVCREADSPADQVVPLQSNCEAIVEGREILDLPRLPPGGRRDCCFAIILRQEKFLLLLSDSPDDCSQWLKVLRKVREGVTSPVTLQRQQSITPCITDRDPLPDSPREKDPPSPRLIDKPPSSPQIKGRENSFRDRGPCRQRSVRSGSVAPPHRSEDCLRHGNSSDARAVRAVCLLMGGAAASSALGYLNSCSPSGHVGNALPSELSHSPGFSDLSGGSSYHACSQAVDSPHFNSFDFEADSDFDAFDCGGFAF
ncbi:uncharacterized protein LOC114769718 [Denticeps clupeoides]|uniref:uncharacterized protein LOC114769718 n=1 Tax=Denticeps clupeoides TaxID=299321 RepID=UPI0010A3089C|nr:uncharacterized protein LOC114769718 [Denticeps clupeoides]XP_028818821.1 uncharacterized protein LOC114769718 [Denticeps clupeoides]